MSYLVDVTSKTIEFFVQRLRTTLYDLMEAAFTRLQAFHEVNKLAANSNVKSGDRVFEVFKTLAPDLWEQYRSLPHPEFLETLKQAVSFSRLSATTFKRHSRLLNTWEAEEKLAESEE